MTSAVFIIPTAERDAANAFAASEGWGEDCFSVALTDGNGVSHYGCRPDVTPGFLAKLAAPPPEAVPILEVLIADLRETDATHQHWLDVLAAQGLVRVGPS